METVKKLALSTVILICGCKPSIEDHKYTISGAHGQTYHTDKITREDDCGCIGTDTKTVTLCGSYTITKNNIER